MQTERADTASRLAKARAEIAEKKARIEELRRRLESNEARIQEQLASVRAIRDSLGWRMVERFRSWHARWLPEGTGRRRVYQAAVRSLASRLRAAAGSQPDEVGRAERAAVAKAEEAFLEIDQPRSGERCSGIVAIRGWCWAAGGVERIEVCADGRELGRAGCGIRRPDIAYKHPKLANAENSGFVYLWDTAGIEDGLHEISVTAAFSGGIRTVSVPVVLDREYENVKYHLWIQSHEPGIEELEELRKNAERLRRRPRFSIVMPVREEDLELARQAVQSVENQVYGEWELLLAGEVLRQRGTDFLTGAGDERIVFAPQERGDSGAGSQGWTERATGDFVCFLRACDTISPDALYWMAERLQEQEADLIYADEDRLDETEQRCEPFFKPDWSPDLLRSMNYIGEFVAARRALVREAGGLKGDAAADFYDLNLRLSEQAKRIEHIPRVLHHRRRAENSDSPDAPQEAAARRVLNDYFSRNGIAARAEAGSAGRGWRVRYLIGEAPKVTIIIPAGPRAELLESCLNSIGEKTDYPHFEILVADNSKTSEVEKLAKAIRLKAGTVRYYDCRGKPFNFSAINNAAVRECTSPLVLFLNDDIEVLDAGWLGALVEHGQRGEVGAAGGKLLYPDGLIQHAGVILGIGGYAGHAFKRLPGETRAHFNFAQLVRNCSAVTAACMLTKRELFLQLGGFNERDLAVAFQDPDYCLRVRAAGYLVVYTPYCTLLHHESASRGMKLDGAEVRYLQRQWGEVIAHDPYYNPNLTRDAEDFGLRLDS